MIQIFIYSVVNNALAIHLQTKENNFLFKENIKIYQYNVYDL